MAFLDLMDRDPKPHNISRPLSALAGFFPDVPRAAGYQGPMGAKAPMRGPEPKYVRVPSSGKVRRDTFRSGHDTAGSREHCETHGCQYKVAVLGGRFCTKCEASRGDG